MKFFNYNLLLIAILMFLCISCGESKKENPKEDHQQTISKNTKLTLPLTNSMYHLGDAITFEVSNTGAAIDSIAVDYEGNSSVFKTKKFDWTIKNAKTGNQKIRIKAYSGGNTETHFARVIFLSDEAPESYGYEVIKSYPHNTDAFTQGLFFKEDTLIESVGLRGKSRLSKVDLQTAKIYESVPLDNKYFGEGSCYWNGQYIQITWTSQTGFVFDDNFNKIKSFRYTHEGWGITVWGDTLFVSDGTNIIHKLSPYDFTEFGKLEVYDNEEKIVDLNELEMIDGLLYANIYQEDVIAVIDPKTGKLLRTIDMSGLLSYVQMRNADVLNGIAYHSGRNKIYVTGKLWPSLFEVIFKPKNTTL
jgi:glutaminyl-peptide cyclotransferase